MKYIRYICRTQFRKAISAVLCVCILWASGLLFGRFIASAAGSEPQFVMRISAMTTPIFAVQLICQILPLVLTYFAARSSRAVALYAIILFHGFCFGYAAYLSILAFRTAGWLVYRILFFSERVNGFMLLWAWANVSINRRFLSFRKLYVLSGLMCLVTLFDYFVCSGFLISVLT